MKVLIEHQKYHGFEHLITHTQNIPVGSYYESQEDNHKRIFNYLMEVKIGDGQKPYCPFVKIIEKSNGYYFKCFSLEELDRSFHELERGFKSISPNSTQSNQKPDPLTMIAAFPEQKAMGADFCKLLEQKRDDLRLSFLVQGLMVAHMHPFHSLGSAKEASNLVDEELYVSSIPLLMVRRMHKEDIVFMHTKDELSAYYSFFPKEIFSKCPFKM